MAALQEITPELTLKEEETTRKGKNSNGNKRKGGVITPIAVETKEALVPRLYQLEIVDLAKKSNVLAYLDTGAGKTFIAVLLLRHRYESAVAMLEDEAPTPPPSPPPPTPCHRNPHPPPNHSNLKNHGRASSLLRKSLS